MPLFDQNHGVTPLEKCKFFNNVKMTFGSLNSPVFYLEQYK